MLLLELCFQQSILSSFFYVGQNVFAIFSVRESHNCLFFLFLSVSFDKICGKLPCPGVQQMRQYQPKLILLTLPMYHLKQSLEYHLELHCFDDHTIPKHDGQARTSHNVSEVTHISVELSHSHVGDF